MSDITTELREIRQLLERIAIQLEGQKPPKKAAPKPRKISAEHVEKVATRALQRAGYYRR